MLRRLSDFVGYAPRFDNETRSLVPMKRLPQKAAR